MKRYIALFIGLLLIFIANESFAFADGYEFDDWEDYQLEELYSDLQVELIKRGLLPENEKTTSANAQVQKDSTALVKIDGNTITVRDDGTGESSDGDGMKKTVILTNRTIGYTGECGPMKYEVQSLQIAKIEATGDTANMLGLKSGQEATLFAVQLRVENTSNEDMSWSPYMSTIVTSDKEQVSSDWIMSDFVGGDFYGNVVKQGQIFFLCKNTDAENLSHIQWRIDTPHDSKYNHFGEDVIIEFEFSK